MDLDYCQIKAKLIAELKEFFAKANKTKAIIGLSGGIDSSVSACLTTAALGAENVFAVNLATEFNSQKTIANAVELASNLKINFTKLNIDPVVNKQIEVFEEINFGDNKIKLSTLDKENIRARTRGSGYLAALAGNLNGLILNNGNKTEFTFGYATLYGDLVGAVCPLGDLLKEDVYQLGRTINAEADGDLIPSATFELKPSAELSDDQAIEAGKGDPFWYPYHDQLAHLFTELKIEPEEIMQWYQNDKLEEKIGISGIIEHFGSEEAFKNDLEEKWNMYLCSEYKRFQAPPVIKVREIS